jgi:hypothetical protein
LFQSFVLAATLLYRDRLRSNDRGMLGCLPQVLMLALSRDATILSCPQNKPVPFLVEKIYVFVDIGFTVGDADRALQRLRVPRSKAV